MTSSMNEKPIPQQKNEQTGKSPIPNVFLRLLTGLTMIPLVIVLILFGGWVFALAVAFLVVVGTLEFYFMERHRGLHNNVVIGFVTAAAVLLAFILESALLWELAVLLASLIIFAAEYFRSRQVQTSLVRVVTTLGGVFYIAFPGAFMIAIRGVQPFGIHWVFAILFTTWSADTFAYLFGKMFGKTALTPKLSPNKTREGAVGGLIFSAILPMLVLLRVNELSITTALMLVLAAGAAIVGDLFESGMKRYFDVKDSGVPGFNIFPGHGGVLDRIDSLLWVLPVYYAYLVFAGKLTLLL